MAERRLILRWLDLNPSTYDHLPIVLPVGHCCWPKLTLIPSRSRRSCPCHPRFGGREGERPTGRLKGCRAAFKHGVRGFHLSPGTAIELSIHIL
jgi:hypothetical protein